MQINFLSFGCLWKTTIHVYETKNTGKVGKDVERTGCSLLESTIPTFTHRERERSRKYTGGNPAEIRNGYLPNRGLQDYRYLSL